jgi:hypothetical protein
LSQNSYEEPDTYKLAALENFYPERRVRDLRSQQLTQVLVAFRKNIDRAYALATFLPFLAALTGERERAYCIANLKILKDIEPDPERLDEKTKANLLRKMHKIEEKFHPSKTASQKKERRWRYGLHVVNEILNTESNTEFREAVDGLLPSVILSAWTAFEVLAGDLWEAAVNEHPAKLSQLRGNKLNDWGVGREAVRGEEQSRNGIDEGKSISLQRLASVEFKINDKMGTLLRDKVSFTKLWEIRRSYCSAFSKDYKEISTALSDKAFDHLAAVRNALVHKGGKADGEFRKNVTRSARLSSVSLGEIIPIDGELVSELVSPVVLRCIDLVEAVGKWIESKTEIDDNASDA